MVKNSSPLSVWLLLYEVTVEELCKFVFLSSCIALPNDDGNGEYSGFFPQLKNLQNLIFLPARF